MKLLLPILLLLLLCCQVGFKLLAFDVRVASGLAFKAMRGNQLTRWAAAVCSRIAVKAAHSLAVVCIAVPAATL